jgi:hypothetical protein
MPFTVSLGRIVPAFSFDTLPIDAHQASGSATYELQTGLALDSLQVEAFGLSCGSEQISGQVSRGDTTTHTISVEHCGSLEVVLDGAPADDLDLYLVDPNGATISVSAGGEADESVVVDRPADGDWLAVVEGYAVSGLRADYQLLITSIQGDDIAVSVPSGPFAEGEQIAIELGYTIPEPTSCTTLDGLLFYGPAGGTVVKVPIFIDLLLREHVLEVPGVAHAPGAAGTVWRSDLAVVNTSGEQADLLISYHPSASESPVITRPVALAAGATREWQDILVSLFELDQTAAGKGVVQVGAEQRLVATARTYNPTGSGTYGQLMPGCDAGQALDAGEVGVIPLLASNDKSRSNIGALNLGSTACAVMVSLHGGDGSQLGQSVSLEVPPGRYRQADRIFGPDWAGAGRQDVAYARVEVASGTGPVWAFGSVVDNRSGDPTTIPVLVDREAGPFLVPGMVHASGAQGTTWRSDLALVNRGDQAADLQLRFLPGEPSEETLTATHQLAADGTVVWQDLLVSLFGLAGTAGAKGAVGITSDQPLAVIARTYNQTATATFGQMLPGITLSQVIGPDQVAVIPQLKQNDAFRSNLGVLNAGDTACQVLVRLFGPDGTRLGTEVILAVEPGRYFQANNIFGSQYTGAGPRRLAYATVEVLSAGGQVWAFGSVVDNSTGDPTTIPMVH